MDASLLHPKIVHFPMALAVLMPALSLGLLLCWWRGWLPRRVWWVAVALQAVMVGSSFVSLESGEDEEERVEGIVPGGAIEAHEDAARLFFFGGVGALLLFGAAGYVKKESAALGLAAAAVVGSAGVTALGVSVGEKGGELVYVHGAGAAYGDGAPGVERGQHKDDD